MQSLARELFGFQEKETTGEKILFRFLELFVVFFTIKFCWDWGLYIQRIDTVVLPLGLANYLDISFMFDHGVSLINAALVTLFCALGLLRIWKPAYLIVLLLFHLQYVARYCLGEISHGSNFIGMSVMGLALAMLFFEEGKRRHRFTFGFLYFTIGIAYTSAAFCKLIGTGITWPDGRHLWMWMAERQVDVLSMSGTFEPNILQQLILSDYRFGTLVLGFGLIAELCAFLMWWRRFRYIVIPALICVHFGIALSMNIFFGAYTYQLIILGFPWPVLIDRLLASYRPLQAQLRGWQFLSA